MLLKQIHNTVRKTSQCSANRTVLVAVQQFQIQLSVQIEKIIQYRSVPFTLQRSESLGCSHNNTN